MMASMTTPAPAMDEQTRLRAQRRTLLIVLAMFILPVTIAAFLYWFGWRPAKTANHGELIQPPQMLASAVLNNHGGGSMKLADLNGRWTMLYITTGACDAACQKNIYYMRQIHTGFAKELDRIQEALIVLDGAPDAGLGNTLRDYPRLKCLTGSSAQNPALSAQFKTLGTAPNKLAGHLYLVDPRGFVMMRYTAEPDPAGIRRDLEKLLKYSWVG